MEDQLFIVRVVKQSNEEVVLEYKNIKYNEKNKVAIITLDRPDFLNALCNELIEEVGHALDSITLNDNIHVVILKGSSKAFAAGADISQMKRDGYMIKSSKVPMARILKRMNEHCTVIPPKELPVRDILVSEYWISK